MEENMLDLLHMATEYCLGSLVSSGKKIVKPHDIEHEMDHGRNGLAMQDMPGQE
jgi:hypothetical protein